jgi:hypothetical protein
MNLLKHVTGGGAAFVLAAIFMAGCASQGPAVRLHGDLSSFEKIAILPFQNMTALYGTNATVISPISGRAFITGPVADRADLLLNNLLITHVRRDTTFQTVQSRNAAAILDDLEKRQGQTRNRRQLLSQTGQQLGADAIMIGHLYRFRERVGQEVAAESGASVAFDIYLIDCRQDRLLWNAFYNYTQQALSDNLYDIRNFMRRGGRWVTAEELATAAFNQIFEDFPQP